MLAAGLGLLAFLGLTGYALDQAFADTALASQRERLQTYLQAYIARSEVTRANQIVVDDEPPEPRFAQPGDCVANHGTEQDPDLVLTECAPGALEVLARFDATNDTGECTGVQGYRYHYFYDSELTNRPRLVVVVERLTRTTTTTTWPN